MEEVLLNLLLQCSLKQFGQQELLPVILGVIEHSENHILHESVGLALRHLEDQFRKVVWIGLEEVEEMLVSLQWQKVAYRQEMALSSISDCNLATHIIYQQ